MNVNNVFKMPKPIKIVGRTSSITNAFVNGIIPTIVPTEQEIIKCLDILNLNAADLRCAYCGDKATEWDHLRPIVSDKRPTGYISEIHNLVPACGKCNQSKGNKYWKEWIQSSAPLSPQTRQIPDLSEKIRRLEIYETWKQIKPLDFESLVGKDAWDRHWKNCEELHELMKECQKFSDNIKKIIQDKYSTGERV